MKHLLWDYESSRRRTILLHCMPIFSSLPLNYCMPEPSLEQKWQSLRFLVWPENGTKGLIACPPVQEFLDMQRSRILIQWKHLCPAFLMFDVPITHGRQHVECLEWKALLQGETDVTIRFESQDSSDAAMVHWQIGSLHKDYIWYDEGYLEGNPLIWHFKHLRRDMKYLLEVQKLT